MNTTPAAMLIVLSKEPLSMKDPIEVLRTKEKDILRVKQEVEALRIAADLLGEEPASAGDRRIEFRQVVNMP
jgi:hypothetical protein